MASKRPSYTTQEQKTAWKQRNYKQYLASLRYDSDQDIIDYIEEHKGRGGVTPIIREALRMYIEAQKAEG